VENSYKFDKDDRHHRGSRRTESDSPASRKRILLHDLKLVIDKFVHGFNFLHRIITAIPKKMMQPPLYTTVPKMLKKWRYRRQKVCKMDGVRCLPVETFLRDLPPTAAFTIKRSIT
jgi:hypothetical protein